MAEDRPERLGDADVLAIRDGTGRLDIAAHDSCRGARSGLARRACRARVIRPSLRRPGDGWQWQRERYVDALANRWSGGPANAHHRCSAALEREPANLLSKKRGSVARKSEVILCRVSGERFAITDTKPRRRAS